MKVYLIAFLVSALVGVLGYWGATALWGARTQKSDALDRLSQIAKWESKGVPDFQIHGHHQSLKALSEPIKVVHFWASWCGPCVEELPSLQQLSEKLGDKIIIIALSQDSSEKAMTDFLAEHKIESRKNLKFIYDEKPRISAQYRSEKLPESFIIGQDLKLKKRISGSIEWVTPESLTYFESLLSGASQ